MATVLQIVPTVGSTSPTLDLNAVGAGLFQLAANPEPSFAPPLLRRATAGTLLADGQPIPAAAFDNRTIAFTLRLLSATQGQKQTALTGLAQQLNQARNVLRLQFADASVSTWYRLLRSPSNPIRRVRPDGKALLVDVEMLAEPFGYGAKVTVGPTTITDDPAAGSNGMFLDVTGVGGDVETPLSFSLPAGDLDGTDEPLSVFAVRRRGTVTNVPFVLQAESCTLGTDTTLPGNDTVMSGSGSNYARTSFATDASLTARLSLNPWPAATNKDNRGTYRALACVRKSVNTDTVKMRLGYLGGSPPVAGVAAFVYNDTVTLGTGLGTGRMVVDLGLIPVPAGPDPTYDGYSGTELSVKGRAVEVDIQRSAGTGNCDVDYLLFVPADDSLSIVDWGDSASGTDEFVIDAPAGMVYTRLTTGEIYAAGAAQVAGSIGVMVSPGVTNRVYFVRRVGPGVANTKTNTTAVTCWYWPRTLTWLP